MGESRLPDDRFDEVRRAWIAAHQGLSLIQRRRAEQLGRRIRARQRVVAAAVPDPHDDTAIPPIWLRAATSPAARLEWMAVMLLCVAAPVGWLGGWTLHRVVARLVPNVLRAYPIPALTWSGVALEAVVVACADPGPHLGRAVLLTWWCAQIAIFPAVAGVLAVLDGWLAVPGSDRWWPLAPGRVALSAADAVDILGGYDVTGPGVVDARRLNPVGERSA